MVKNRGPERRVVKSANKGTRTVVESFTPLNWAGKGFKENQEKALGKIKGLMIGSSKGTSKIDLSKMRKTKIPSVDGRYISVKKGTELLRL